MEKKEQKQVRLIGVRTSGHNILQACELTPDLLEKRLVLITGNTGQGKSSLLDIAKASIAGSEAVKKKDILPNGFIAESLLVDGNIKLYAGVSMGQYTKGEKKGEPKYDVFLYAKDDNGKSYAPIIDGVQVTASKYLSSLTTELTFSLPDLFSENQTTHRKLIEKLFKPELDALGADEVVARIISAKTVRDAKRAICQGNGAYMEQFGAEGFTERDLEALSHIDTEKISGQITDLKIEKDRILNAPESDWKLKCAEVDAKRLKDLQTIKDEGTKLREEIKQLEEKNAQEYTSKKEVWDADISAHGVWVEKFTNIQENIQEFLGEGDDLLKIKKILSAKLEEYRTKYVKPEPVKAAVDPALESKLQKIYTDYKALEAQPKEYPAKTVSDTSVQDAKIEALELTKKGADKNNNLYNRFQMWRGWIESKGLYEKELDALRKLYASIDCGVEGMKIVPMESESGKVDVWIQYNACYDPEYFNNPKKEHRFMFEYSSFQRTLIGLMLQAARLDLKPKALRLAFVDDVAFTTRDISVLQGIAEKFDLHLITAWTHEAEKEELIDGQVLVEGGEVFFK